MKSVIQEGSSLSKAIENGWIKAGKPREFTIKIFQESKKNFFGITTTPAKVGIFFKEVGVEVKDIKKNNGTQKQTNQQRSQQYNKQHNKKRFYKQDRRDSFQNKRFHKDTSQKKDDRDNTQKSNTFIRKEEDKE